MFGSKTRRLQADLDHANGEIRKLDRMLGEASAECVRLGETVQGQIDDIRVRDARIAELEADLAAAKKPATARKRTAKKVAPKVAKKVASKGE